MNVAFLYCTMYVGEDDDNNPSYVGEVADEGSMRDLIAQHCQQHGNDHAKTIHLIVEGSPEYHEVWSEDFPFVLPEAFNAELAERRKAVAS